MPSVHMRKTDGMTLSVCCVCAIFPVVTVQGLTLEFKESRLLELFSSVGPAPEAMSLVFKQTASGETKGYAWAHYRGEFSP